MAVALKAAIETGSCPSPNGELEDRKIWHEAYIAAHEGETQVVAIVLKEGGNPELCNSSTKCANASDWRSVSASSEQQVRCVLDSLGDGRVNGLAGLWYDRPQITQLGQFPPVGRIFRATLAWEDVLALAKHPFVARIEPMPGAQLQWADVGPPPMPCDCPDLAEDVAPGVFDAGAFATLEGPTAVNIRLKALPERQPPLQDSDEAPFQSYERSVASSRQLFCVQRALDQVLGAPTSTGPQAEVDLLNARSLPPFEDIPAVRRAFSVIARAEDIKELAKHPYVEMLELLPNAAASTECPPNLDEVIETPECNREAESTEGKIGETLIQAHTDGCEEPFSVAVSVEGGATYCQLPECPAEPSACPERDAWEAHWRAENLAAQTCVRQLLESLGGTIEDDTSTSNKFYARLTWSEIQALAAHPDVLNINENELPCGAFVPPP